MTVIFKLKIIKHKKIHFLLTLCCIIERLKKMNLKLQSKKKWVCDYETK